MDPLSLTLEAAPKALVYASALFAAGVCVARRLWRGLTVAAASSSVDEACARAAMGAGSLLVLGLLLRAAGHTATVFGPASVFDGESLRVVAWESNWGWAWQRQLAAAAAFAVFTWSTTQWGDAGWSLAELGAVALCYVLPLTGHAGGDPAAIVVHGTHLLVAGLWLGTLVAAIVVTRTRREGAAAERRSAEGVESPTPVELPMKDLLTAFAPVAAPAVVAVAMTGGLMAAWYLGALGALFSSRYGQVLLVKGVLVLDAMTFGFLNWKALHRPAGSSPARPQMAFLVAEVAAAAAIVIVTAVLTELEHP